MSESNDLQFALIGPPGSGKGTQAEIIESSLGIPRITMGDLLRNEINSKSKIWSNHSKKY